MRTLLRLILALGIVVALAAIVAGVLVWQLPAPHGTITLGDESVVLHGFDDLDGRLAVLGIAIATAAVIGTVTAAAVAVVFALGAALLAIAGAMLAVAGAVLLTASPLILIGWLLWLVLRAPRPLPAVREVPATVATAS